MVFILGEAVLEGWLCFRGGFVRSLRVELGILLLLTSFASSRYLGSRKNALLYRIFGKSYLDI